LTRKLPKILVYGYGNPGRQDDGLGISLAEELEKLFAGNPRVNLQTDTNYQLNLEDAANIAEYDIVIFADASTEDIADFRFESLKPSGKNEFTLHAVSPAYVLYLSEQMFGHVPKAYLMHIRGYAWEFMGEMSEKARSNLKMATGFISKFINEHGMIQ
jgi:hydrogenase maturation protease